MLGKLAFTNKIVAKNLGQDEARVTKVMDFFIGELNSELMRAEHPFIYVRGLGTFGLTLKCIETRLRHTITHYRKTRKGVGVRNTEKSLLALRQTLFELFALRRLIKDKRKELKILRDEQRKRKAIHDNQGKLVQADEQESGPLQEEDESLSSVSLQFSKCKEPDSRA